MQASRPRGFGKTPYGEKASQTFRSAKIEIIRIFVFGERRPEFARTGNQRACDVLSFLGFGADLLDGLDNQ